MACRCGLPRPCRQGAGGDLNIITVAGLYPGEYIMAGSISSGGGNRCSVLVFQGDFNVCQSRFPDIPVSATVYIKPDVAGYLSTVCVGFRTRFVALALNGSIISLLFIYAVFVISSIPVARGSSTVTLYVSVIC